MRTKKDSKNPNINFEPAIEEQILKGLSSGLKTSKNTAYSLTYEATSDIKNILNLIPSAEGLKRRCKAFTAWDKLFSFLSKHPDFGKDASHYAHGLQSHFIGGINKRIYYILGHEREIIIVRIISVEIPLHVQMAINQYTQK